MKDIDLILALPASKAVKELQKKPYNIPSWSVLINDYEPTLHSILTDPMGRKDKFDSRGNLIGKAARIYIGLEKLLTNRMSEFCFAIPVKRVYRNTEGNQKRQEIAKAIESIYKHARIDSENRRRSVAYFASCETCTIWYTVNSPNTLYGFKSKYKLKCKTFSPMNGNKLYPLFDEYGDMIAMSFKYDVKSGDENMTYFETFTSNKHIKWVLNGTSWEQLGESEDVSILKIPAIYMSRPKPIYAGLSYLREEIEYTLSRNSDIIAYNASPVLKVSGEIVGAEEKGEARRVYRMENGGDVSYVSWNQSIESMKYQVETMLKLFWTQSQMPDISFESMKALGNIGYDARQTLLTDAHLKVGDESWAFIEAFERETNVIKAFLKEMNTSWADEIDNVSVEHIITPFIQNDEKAEIDKWVNACGGKAVVSQLEAIKYLGVSDDAEGTLKQIKEEEADSSIRKVDVFG